MPARTHSSHWGGFTVEMGDGEIAAVHPLHDPDPSPLLRNLPGSLRHRARIERPVARRGWLEGGASPSRNRGNDVFVTLSWDEALDRAAAEYRRVIGAHGNEAIFGGSYGWASAGLFHQSQRQLHRFLALLGGFTSSRNSYSIGASLVLLPHVVGSAAAVFRKATSWPVIAEHTELLVAFGGLPIKNTFVAPGGMARHGIRSHLADARRRGMQIAHLSPLRDDVVREPEARWYPLVPLSDVAVMLALCHVLVTEGLHDKTFLDRCCHGADRFLAYVLGEQDGVAKNPEWAASRSGLPAEDLRALARQMAASRTLVTVSYSLQRAQHGEQPVWAAIARHADLIFPATTSFERNDFGSGRADARIIAMQQVAEPVGQARSDHAILAGLAQRLDVGAAFTEGLGEREWLERLYGELRASLAAAKIDAPPFAQFWSEGSLAIPDVEAERVLFDAFRADPAANPLKTPSGRIELFSETVASFGYDDCPGYPAWLEGEEWLGAPRARRFPLALVANNPATRLHGQLDLGPYSQAAKVKGREPVRIHPTDAAARNIADGDVVRLFNDRGSCLAGAVVTTDVRAGVVQLSTGAWFDPDDPGAPLATCVHGNPNVLTRDAGTSRLSQGCAGQHALVQLERFTGALPPVRAFEPPSRQPRR